MTPSAETHFCVRILDRRDVSPDLSILCINPGGPLAYRAGQYATLGIDGIDKEGVRTERAYSIASAPWEDALEIFVELLPDGHLTPNLFQLRPGDTLLCRKAAKGRFTFDLHSGRSNHLLILRLQASLHLSVTFEPFIATGKTVGLPCLGTTGCFACKAPAAPSSLATGRKLEGYSAEVPWFKYVATVSRPWEHPGWSGKRGRVDDLLRKYTDHWQLRAETTTAYLCGHPKMIENSRGILARAGWKNDALLEEAYYPAIKESAASA